MRLPGDGRPDGVLECEEVEQRLRGMGVPAVARVDDTAA